MNKLLIVFLVLLISTLSSRSDAVQAPVLDEGGKKLSIAKETAARKKLLNDAMKEAEKWRARTPRPPVDISDEAWKRYAREVPEWYQDAKFGVYAHWGPYNLGMETANFTGTNNSWYPKYIYATGHPYNVQHVKLMGPLKKFGYKDYFEKFSVPKFNPIQWADLVAASGAKFAGPVAMHHDGFAMWDSKLHPWNSKTSAADRDIAGELIAEYRKRGLKIVSTFHHSANVSGTYYGGRPNRPDDGPTDLDSDLSDPAYAKLYGKHASQAEAEAYWLEIVKEFVNKYQPDQVWFDGGMRSLTEEARFEMTSFYYDYCDKNGIEGIIARKHDQIPLEVSLLDFERGGAPEIFPRTWQTDDSPGPWMYIESAEFKGADWVVPLLIDIVSKNGVLLLNIAPNAQGAIHVKQQEMLLKTGQWLAVNGEAVYGSRPWKVHYQGDEPHFYAKGKSFSKTYAKYGSDDFRFTRSKSGDALFVFAMGTPTGDKDQLQDFTIESLTKSELAKENGASIVGGSHVRPLMFDEQGKVVVPAKALLELERANGRTTTQPVVFKVSGIQK